MMLRWCTTGVKKLSTLLDSLIDFTFFPANRTFAEWAIASDGGRYRGAEGVNAVVAAVLGTAVPLFVYSLPGIRQLQDIVYYLVASNRSRLPGDHPYCAQHPAECR